MKNLIAILFYLLLLLSSCFVFADQKEEIRRVDRTKLEELKADDDLIYSTEFNIDVDPIERIWNWITRQFYYILSQATTDGPVRYIVLGLITLIFIYGILKLIGVDPSFKMMHRNKDISYGGRGGIVEDVIGQDFKSIIEQAYKNQNFKEVVRNYYLFALDRMDAAGIIRFKKGKTNYEYLDEVSDTGMRSEFSTLNNYFVFAVYGEFDVNEKLADEARTLFEKINSTIR